jgi:hypothetical protein
MELQALKDELIPPQDLGICFSVRVQREPFHTRFLKVTEYRDIQEIITEMT